eukprot:SAG31_NODE_5055_length_2770_cov_3.616249_1_plen_585_part_10
MADARVGRRLDGVWLSTAQQAPQAAAPREGIVASVRDLERRREGVVKTIELLESEGLDADVPWAELTAIDAELCVYRDAMPANDDFAVSIAAERELGRLLTIETTALDDEEHRVDCELAAVQSQLSQTISGPNDSPEPEPEGAAQPPALFECLYCFTGFPAHDGVLCRHEQPGHFLCNSCFCGDMPRRCAAGGQFETMQEFTSDSGTVVQSAPGSLPCFAFGQEGCCAALDEGEILRCIHRDERARNVYMGARIRFAQAQAEREARRQRRAQPVDAVQQARRLVEEATMLGAVVVCPECHEGTEKNDACMHMRCRCGAQYCYSCGGRSGGGRRCQCDAGSPYLEQNRLFRGCTAREALRQFHALRIRACIKMARETIRNDGVWRQLQAQHPHLLRIPLWGNAIDFDWDEDRGPNALWPRLGNADFQQIIIPQVRGIRQRLQERWRDMQNAAREPQDGDDGARPIQDRIRPRPDAVRPGTARLCVHFGRGACQRGAACTYAHGAAELAAWNTVPADGGADDDGAAQVPRVRPRPDAVRPGTARLCVHFGRGACQRGAACTYAHGAAELAAWNTVPADGGADDDGAA